MVRAGLTAAALALAAAAAACGVPEEKYNAQLAEVERFKRSVADEGQRVKDCEVKVSALTTRIQDLEAEKTADAAELERQRQLFGQLASTKEQLEAEASAQRQLAARLVEEKSALEKRSAEYEALTASLSREIQAGQIQISELQGKVTVRLAERILFPSGSATLSSAGKEPLRKIAGALRGVKGRIIRVEGHTDDVPIRNAQFASNWELSAARAIAVVRVLQGEGVDPTLLGAAGYAEYQPIASNATAEGRAQNRRIEISLAPAAAPVATSP